MKRETEPFAWGLIASLYYLFLIAVLFSQLSCRVPQPRLMTPGALRTADAVMHTVEVHAVCSDHTAGTGSGVLAGGETVLTAWHVVNCGKGKVLNVMVKMSTGEAFIADVVHEWKYRDVAKLRVYGLASHPAVAIASINIGDRLCSSSVFPYLRSVCGVLTSVYDTTCPKSEWCHNAYFSADGPVIPGNSGSPVYNSDGALVGLVTGGTPVWIPNPWALMTALWDLREDLQ